MVTGSYSRLTARGAIMTGDNSSRPSRPKRAGGASARVTVSAKSATPASAPARNKQFERTAKTPAHTTTPHPGAAPRAAAARAVSAVLHQQQSLNQCVNIYQKELADPRDRALMQELTYGSLRFGVRLQRLTGLLLQRPLADDQPLVSALLLIGLYQLLYLRVPAHAAVAATVEACRTLPAVWACSLVNAVCRRFLRERDALLRATDTDTAARVAHPRWLVGQIRRAYPHHAEAIFAANNTRPPMTLRINLQRSTRADYLAQLQARGIAAQIHPLAGQAIVLEHPVEVADLPGFTQGWVSVQDAAAQLAAPLLPVSAGERVLDACAAPGGKTTHLLERQPQARLLALDISAARNQRLQESLARLQLQAEVLAADASQPHTWARGEPFDHILLDAPCSGSGVICRHPDIKFLRRADDLAALAQKQGTLLRALWPLLKPRGKLLYVTCSILPTENADVIRAFLRATPDARHDPLAGELADGGALTQEYGVQFLPRAGEAAHDGFYFARLYKEGCARA